MKLFLDDIRLVEHYYLGEWIVVRSYKEFCEYISHTIPETISFDNDLGEENNIILPTGYDCLNYLIDNDIYIKNIIVHTDNTVASDQIFYLSKNWHKHLISEKIFKQEECSVIRRPALFNKLK